MILSPPFGRGILGEGLAAARPSPQPSPKGRGRQCSLETDFIMNETNPTRLIVGITGATGTIFGVRLVQMLHGSSVETHMVMSKWAARTLIHETPHTVEQVEALASRNYPLGDQGAAISSGSVVTPGLVVVPCSLGTL